MRKAEAEIRREQKKKVRRLRREGKVPAVIYGKSIGSKPLTLDAKMISKACAEEEIYGLWDLEVNENGQRKNYLAVVQDIQRHLLTNEIIHIDFHEVKRDQKAVFRVPVELLGQPQGVKEGGILEQHIRMLEIECFPDSLPEKIAFDVSELGLGEMLRVGELKMPEGVECKTPEDEAVAIVVELSRFEEKEGEAAEAEQEETTTAVEESGKKAEADQEDEKSR